MDLPKKEEKVAMSFTTEISIKKWLDSVSKKSGYSISEIISNILKAQKDIENKDKKD